MGHIPVSQPGNKEDNKLVPKHGYTNNFKDPKHNIQIATGKSANRTI
jgi:hypothetical protein